MQTSEELPLRAAGFGILKSLQQIMLEAQGKKEEKKIRRKKY